MFRIAICDDEATSLQLNKALTEKILKDENIEYEIETYVSMNDLLDEFMKLRTKMGFDLLLSDILTTEMNGIDAAKQIRKIGENLDIIFISTTDEYALDGYQVQALRYLKKPVDIDKLKEALLLSYSKHSDVDGIKIATDRGKEVFVKFEDIYYVESQARDVEITTADEKFLTHFKISDMEKLLPENLFFRCHRSYIVNLSKIDNLERYDITMKNGDYISVSQQLYSETKLRYSRQ